MATKDDKGWIRLHRSIMDNWIWQRPEPFDHRSAWVDMIMLANYKSQKANIGGEVIITERGTLYWSQQSLADRWHWSRPKVRRFLRLLESDGMITMNVTTHGTTISLVNYSKFQVRGTTNVPTNVQPMFQPPSTDKEYIDKSIYKNERSAEAQNYYSPKKSQKKTYAELFEEYRRNAEKEERELYGDEYDSGEA